MPTLSEWLLHLEPFEIFGACKRSEVSPRGAMEEVRDRLRRTLEYRLFNAPPVDRIRYMAELSRRRKVAEPKEPAPQIKYVESRETESQTDELAGLDHDSTVERGLEQIEREFANLGIQSECDAEDFARLEALRDTNTINVSAEKDRPTALSTAREGRQLAGPGSQIESCVETRTTLPNTRQTHTRISVTFRQPEVERETEPQYWQSSPRSLHTTRGENGAGATAPMEGNSTGRTELGTMTYSSGPNGYQARKIIKEWKLIFSGGNKVSAENFLQRIKNSASTRDHRPRLVRLTSRAARWRRITLVEIGKQRVTRLGYIRKSV